MAEPAHASNYLLAVGTILAALFVAVQAWYARIAYVEESETRFLERKLDICFENFDQAAALDSALRFASSGAMLEDVWPPRVRIADAAALRAVQRDVVPHLNALEAGLTKASVLGSLDKFRAYLEQQARGLSKRAMDLDPAALGTETEGLAEVERGLSEFIGAQYQVFTGCRALAGGAP